MSQTEMNLYNNTLMLTAHKLLFEGQVIYNFEDRYANLSSLGVEAQEQFFYNLINIIFKTNLILEEKAEILMIVGTMLKVMSERNEATSILVIGESVATSIYAQVIKLFGNENRLFEISHNQQLMTANAENITSILTDGSYFLDSLPNNHFSLVITNFNSVKNHLATVFRQCESLVSKNSKMVIYGHGIPQSGLINIFSLKGVNVYRLNGERALLSIDINDEKVNPVNEKRKEQILGLILTLKTELIHKFEFLKSAPPAHSEWHRTTDDAILLLSRIETIVTKHHTLFENKDLKFQTNEVKNALLDLKYEVYLSRRHFNFFHSLLFQQYNLWIQNFV